LRSNDRPDAGLVEQSRCECAHVAEQFAFELGDFDRRGLDPAGEAAQDEPRARLQGEETTPSMLGRGMARR